MKIDIEYNYLHNYDESAIENFIKKIIKHSVKLLKIENVSKYELSILITNNKQIKKLNYKYLNKRKNTNILSFPQLTFNKELNKGLNYLLGDIVLSLEKIDFEAKKYNKKFDERFAHLLIHGFLHLLGFKHNDDLNRKKMEKIEKEILFTLNIQDPYLSG